MAKTADVTVPDLGDFHDVAIIEIPVKVGESIRKDQPLVTLETDKATMDVPSPMGGVLKELLVAVGAKVSKGSRLAVLEVADEKAGKPTPRAPARTMVIMGSTWRITPTRTRRRSPARRSSPFWPDGSHPSSSIPGRMGTP